jgi:hypothetical protein
MLDLNLNFAKDSYRAGEPVEGTFTLRNSGAEPALVNARLGINSPYVPAQFRDLTVNVVAPSGDPLAFVARVNMGSPADQDFKLLQPGESVHGTFAINDFFELEQPGAYQVQATYHNQSEPSHVNGHAVWKGELKSNPATITIQR